MMKNPESFMNVYFRDCNIVSIYMRRVYIFCGRAAKVLDPRSRGLSFDSSSLGYVRVKALGTWCTNPRQD